MSGTGLVSVIGPRPDFLYWGAAAALFLKPMGRVRYGQTIAEGSAWRARDIEDMQTGEALLVQTFH